MLTESEEPVHLDPLVVVTKGDVRNLGKRQRPSKGDRGAPVAEVLGASLPSAAERAGREGRVGERPGVTPKSLRVRWGAQDGILKGRAGTVPEGPAGDDPRGRAGRRAGKTRAAPCGTMAAVRGCDPSESDVGGEAGATATGVLASDVGASAAGKASVGPKDEPHGVMTGGEAAGATEETPEGGGGRERAGSGSLPAPEPKLRSALIELVEEGQVDVPGCLPQDIFSDGQGSPIVAVAEPVNADTGLLDGDGTRSPPILVLLVGPKDSAAPKSLGLLKQVSGAPRTSAQ